MPNAPKTPTRTFRCDDKRWAAIKAKTAREGLTVTDVLIAAIDAYIDADDENLEDSDD